MTLSTYHQKYKKQSDEEIHRKADTKEQELASIFQEVSLNTESDPVRLAVLGCGDRRLVAHHKRIFENVLKKNVEVTTFDITIDHLAGESNVFQHDCTLPLPNAPYDITYAHVLLKFIETEKQFDLLKNSFDTLKPGGVAIHVFDKEEIEAKGPKLPSDLWAVPLDKWKQKLMELGIEYKEIPVKYGLALVLLKKKS
jgi:SAM-dependent methyltransferase